MSAVIVPVSLEEVVSRFAFPVGRGEAARAPGIGLPEVVPASRLVDRPAAATVLTGIEPLDALTGGLPRGGLTEICGPASSGRTSVLLALMASMTASPTLANPLLGWGTRELCALVDASDSFDPKSGSAAGVDLRRLLWVRCSPRRQGGTEKSISDCRLPIAEEMAWSVGSGQTKSQITNRKSQMDLLEQALKATDLLLQGGGFGLVVVDLGDVPAQAARRVPLTSWFRFRRAVENTRTVLLVLEQEPYAKTCASVVVKLAATSSQLSASGQWSVASGRRKDEPAHARILSGLQITAEVVRSATQGKKPVRSTGARFASRAQWA